MGSMLFIFCRHGNEYGFTVEERKSCFLFDSLKWVKRKEEKWIGEYERSYFRDEILGLKDSPEILKKILEFGKMCSDEVVNSMEVLPDFYPFYKDHELKLWNEWHVKRKENWLTSEEFVKQAADVGLNNFLKNWRKVFGEHKHPVSRDLNLLAPFSLENILKNPEISNLLFIKMPVLKNCIKELMMKPHLSTVLEGLILSGDL